MSQSCLSNFQNRRAFTKAVSGMFLTEAVVALFRLQQMRQIRRSRGRKSER